MTRMTGPAQGCVMNQTDLTSRIFDRRWSPFIGI